MTLTLNSLLAVVMTYSHAKVQGQGSVGFEDRVETNGRTDIRTNEGDCITCRINAVGKYVYAGLNLITYTQVQNYTYERASRSNTAMK